MKKRTEKNRADNIKKIFCSAIVLFLTASILTLLPACVPGRTNRDHTDGIVLSESFTIAIGDVFENETELTARLGEPVRRQESQSCIAVGTDINLSYDGFSLTLYPSGDSAHVVGNIKLSSPSFATIRGIRPGDALSSIDATPYSLSSHSGSDYTYFLDNSSCFLIVSVDDSGAITRLILGSSEFMGTP